MKTFKPQGAELVEEARMERPFRPKYKDRESFSLACTEYDLHLDSLLRYVINPNDWKGITQVKEGEFEVQYQIGWTGTWLPCSKESYDSSIVDRRLFAIPKRLQTYQPLFSLLSTHGLTLTQGEMDEIIDTVKVMI